MRRVVEEEATGTGGIGKSEIQKLI